MADRSARRAPTVRPTQANLPLRRMGRWVVWAVLTLLLIRGVIGIIHPPASQDYYINKGAAHAWRPSPQEISVAEEFAREYLSVGEGRRAGKATAWFSEGAEATMPVAGRSATEVISANPAAWHRVDRSHALITIDALIRVQRRMLRRYLAVPIVQSGGGVAVYSEPAFVAAPPINRQASGPSGEAGEPTEAPAAVVGLARRFLPLYLKGKDISYYLPPGRQISEPQGLAMESLEAVETLAGGHGQLRVAARVAVRDETTGATFPALYTLTVKRADRWYVTAVESR